MLAATTIAIFVVPVLFVLITRASYGKKRLEYLRAHHDDLMEKAKKVEAQSIDPELEFEIQKSRDLHGMEPRGAGAAGSGPTDGPSLTNA
jgi:HAE1 family hydrophobic/amphiphilic exporter-1